MVAAPLDVIPVIPHRRLVALLAHSFALRLAVSPSGFGELASPPLRGFLIGSAASDLAKDTLALHLPLEHEPERRGPAFETACPCACGHRVPSIVSQRG